MRLFTRTIFNNTHLTTTSARFFSSQQKTHSNSNLSSSKLPYDPARFLAHQYQPEKDQIVIAKISGLPKVKQPLAGKNCLITVSMGPSAPNELQLAAILDGLYSRGVQSCGLVIGDTSQRWMMRIKDPKLSEDRALKASELEGIKWVDKNSKIWYRLPKRLTTFAWIYWLEHPDFSRNLELIAEAYENEPTLRQALRRNIDQYLNRLEARGELALERIEAEKLCLEYFKEECAVQMGWAQESWDHELYANAHTNDRSSAMQAVYERYIKPFNKLVPLHVKFCDIQPNEQHRKILSAISLASQETEYPHVSLGHHSR